MLGWPVGYVEMNSELLLYGSILWLLTFYLTTVYPVDDLDDLKVSSFFHFFYICVWHVACKAPSAIGSLLGDCTDCVV